jgi:hypothetical protein
MATTRISDLIVPEVFEPYVADEIVRKLNLVQSGAVTRDGNLDRLLAGGGAVFNFPFYNNLAETGEVVASDDPSDVIVPEKVTASNLLVARCVRAVAWQVANLDELLTGSDPMAFIGSRVADFRIGALQKQFLAVVQGIFANNASATDSYHKQNDQRIDLSSANSGTYLKGTTDFNVNALIDAISLLGDAQDGFGMIMVHPLVFANMQKQDVIDTRIPSTAGAPTYYYNGYQIILNNDVPCTVTSGSAVCSTYIFGRDQFRLGFGSVDEPLAYEKNQAQGNGYGISTMYARWCNALAPKGYSYVGASTAVGGPSNASTSTNLANAGSWRRVAGDVRSCQMVELVTRES